MASYVKEITLDLNANMAYTTIVAKQGDSARWLKIHLTKDNIPYPLNALHNFMFRMRKPDGHGVINPAVVQLGTTSTYIKITITENNFSNRDYYIQENNNYILVSIDSFFNIVEEPEEDKTLYYVKDNDVYRKATNDDEGPFYIFFVDPLVQYYYLEDNINYEESTINVQLTEQILAVSGRGYADIVEYDENSDVLSTISFIVNVMASPDVAGNATSSDEFQELIRVVTKSDEIISEAEAWARGTKNNQDVGSAKYERDNDVTEANFNSKKSNLFIKQNNEYVALSESATFDSTEIYYILTVGNNNNAKYYSEQAQVAKEDIENLGVSATTLGTGEDSTINKIYFNKATDVNADNFDEKKSSLYTENADHNFQKVSDTATYDEDIQYYYKSDDSSGDRLTFLFGLPAGVQGAQGDRGTNTVWVSSTAPTDSYYNVWLNPTGNVEPIMVTANQVSYFSETSYLTNTIGQAVQGLNSSIGLAVAAAAAASDSASMAAADASQAIESVSAIDERVIALETGIVKKIENPELSSNTGILYAQQGTDKIDIQWVGQLNYNNDLLDNSLPQINGHTLKGNKSYSDLGIAPASGGIYYVKPTNGIPSTDLENTVQTSLSKGNTSIQSIKINNNILPKTDGTVDLGTVLTNNNIVNKNYLDNPWFTINQRIIGDSYSLSNTTGYICDRWKVITNTNRTVTWQRGSHIYIGTGNQSKIVLCQIIDPDTFNSLKNKQITISVDCTVDSTRSIISWQGICPNGNTTNPDAMPQVFKDGYRWGGKLVVSDNTLYFQILFDPNDFAGSSDNGITIYKTKIELGEFSTLAQDAKPIEHEELVKCQRYFQQYTLPYAENAKPMILGSGIAAASGSNGQIDWVINVANDMVKTPIIRSSVDLSAKRGFEASATSVGVLSSSDLANSTILKGIKNVCIQTKASNLTISAPYFITLPATASDSGATLAYFSLSAEP